MTALDRPLNGKLFLVAGGILGKFYCGRIKGSGGGRYRCWLARGYVDGRRDAARYVAGQ